MVARGGYSELDSYLEDKSGRDRKFTGFPSSSSVPDMSGQGLVTAEMATMKEMMRQSSSIQVAPILTRDDSGFDTQDAAYCGTRHCQWTRR